MIVMIAAVVGGLIVLGLAFYAGYLLSQVKKQASLKREVLEIVAAKRNANIFKSVNTLCMVGIQGQCDLSEISIRIYCILDYIQGAERIDVEKDYPALFELYDVVKDMARGDTRQQLVKQEKMKQTLARQKAESRLSDAIIGELQQLQAKIKPLSIPPSDVVTAVK